MSLFEQIQVATADPATINRLQANVATAFGKLETPISVPVQELQSTGGTTTYLVKPSDVYLVANARGGPIVIVLPTPNRATQAVDILNAYGSNTVTIRQGDGGQLGTGAVSIALKSNEAARMVCTGKAWVRFGS